MNQELLQVIRAEVERLTAELGDTFAHYRKEEQ